MVLNYNIPLPRLLNEQGGEVKRLYPIQAAVNLTITPLSTAVLELPRKDAIPGRSLVEMYTSSGSAGIFRTRSPQTVYGDDTITIQLEHAVAEIGDYLITEELSEETTASQAMTKLFSYYGGSMWQLGSVASNDPVTIQYDRDNVLEGILDLMTQIPSYMLSFNQSSLPWTLSIVHRPDEVSAEGRLSRNIESVTVTEDDTELCTRLYMDGLPNGYIDADTINIYGVVERYIVGDEGLSQSQINRMANLYIEKHKRPKLSIEISAQDLAMVTGETLDALQIGKLYRLAIAGYIAEQNIIELQWSDVYDDPGRVTVILSEEEDTAVTFLHKQSTGGGRGGSKTKQTLKEFWTRIDQQDEYIDIVAAHADEAGNILEQAGMYLNAQGVLIYAEDNVNNVGAKLKVNSDAITAEVANRIDGQSTLSSRIEQTASQIRSEVNDSISGVYSTITQTASQIRMEVGNSISSAYHSIIEQTDSHIRSEVGSAVSGIYTSVIDQTGSYIRSEIQAAASNITTSVIEQTGSYIRTEIAHAASELAGSVIAQTESYVRIQVGTRSNKVYHGEADPSTNPEFELHEGDIWNEDNDKRTWEEMGEDAWEDATTYQWQEYLGPVTKTWHDGKWVEVSSAQAEALATQGIIETQEAIRLTKADIEGNRAQLELTASRLRSQIVDEKAGLTSLIEQTASQIRTEVSDTANGLQSSITQNAGQIALKVSKDGVISSINQTAESIQIQASKINLSGYVTASELSATNASISNLTSGVTQAGYIRTASFRAGAINFGSYALRRGYITVDGTRFNVVMWD